MGSTLSRRSCRVPPRVGAALGLALVVACAGEPEAPEAPEAPEEVEEVAERVEWPQEGAPLTPPAVRVPEGFGKARVYIDAGHGAAGNVGNVGAWCQVEQEHTLAVAEDLAERLRETGAFEVRVSRSGEALPSYAERIAEAEAWADAVISIHSDARLAAEAVTWSPEEGFECRYNVGEHGFSVLWSDEGDEALVAQRKELAVELATKLRQTGFTAYAGRDYEGLYEVDPIPGAWVDRHEPGKRIFMLRRPKVPSIIIETHQALDKEEALRWREERTHEAFAAAVAAGLIEALEDRERAGR